MTYPWEHGSLEVLTMYDCCKEKGQNNYWLFFKKKINF